MNMYDLTPIEPLTIESYQNFDTDSDLRDMDIDELKNEYKRAINDKIDLLEEFEDIKNKNTPTFHLKERIENSNKYIQKVYKFLIDNDISEKEIEKLEKEATGRYNIKNNDE